MSYNALRQRIEETQSRLTPVFVEEAVRALIQEEGEDVGGGVNATRLVRHLLDAPHLSDVEVTWAYGHLKPALRAAFDQIPSLFYFEGD